MTPPLGYDHGDLLEFGGIRSPRSTFELSRAVLLPVPLERTTSYVPGTRGGPREILLASAQLELWDAELQLSVHEEGIATLPEMELPFEAITEALAEVQRVAALIFEHDKFLVTLGGEHSITGPIVGAAADRFPNLSVLQIDAHADLRQSYLGSRWSHACVMRRVLERVPCTQVGIRSLSAEEARDAPALPTQIFYDATMREDPAWMDRVVDTLGPTVYITIDCDGLNPAEMPAVGTPEPGGLSWRELLRLLRATMARRRVVGCDLVELCPIPGLTAPNFLCAKLVYKLLTYEFAGAARGLESRQAALP